MNNPLLAGDVLFVVRGLLVMTECHHVVNAIDTASQELVL
jgi:hypothetical protein